MCLISNSHDVNWNYEWESDKHIHKTINGITENFAVLT